MKLSSYINYILLTCRYLFINNSNKSLTSNESYGILYITSRYNLTTYLKLPGGAMLPKINKWRGENMKPVKLKFEDENLHEEFKIACIKNKTTMQDQLMKMVIEFLKESK